MMLRLECNTNNGCLKGIGDDDVDEPLANIFVKQDDSPVGAYGVRFYKNGQWETVIVDDHFPYSVKNIRKESVLEQRFLIRTILKKYGYR